MDQPDRLVQAMAMSGSLRIIAAQTTSTVETARRRLDLSPVAADAIGRGMTAALMLARLLEKHVRHQRVSLRFEGDGPLGTLIAEGNLDGHARGYVSNPQIDDTLIGVGDAIGKRGMLTVVRGTPPNGAPYTAQVDLVSGEIAKDVAQYLSASEQIASAVMLGVLNRPHGVAAAGGLIIQAFPHAGPDAVVEVERRIRQAPPLSTWLDRLPIEEVIAELLGGLDLKFLSPEFNVALGFRCSCTRTRAFSTLTLLTRDDLDEMIREDGGASVQCQFCNERYTFSPEELGSLPNASDA